jgi:ATP-dependent RNA helicase RhlE
MNQSFLDLGASARTITALEKRGITEPFPIQSMVIPDAIAGRDVLAKSRTGSGKTLAFALPIVERLTPKGSPSALILVPTRELATQVADDFREIASAKGLKVCAAYGGVGLHEQARRAKVSDIIVATPGRLEDLATRKMINLGSIQILVLDEADRMLDMGFQPQVDVIVRRIPAKRQTMFFSATLDGPVGYLAKSYTTSAVKHEVLSPMETVDEVDHVFVKVEQRDKLSALVGLLKEEPGMTLIFVRTKRGAERLGLKLRDQGIKASAIHGDMSQAARENSLKRFRQGKTSVLVATDVAARGLDLDGIIHVINYDPPEDHKAYVHRVGRTARAGRAGTGTTLVSPDQQGDVGRVAAHLKLGEEYERDGLKVPAPSVAYSSHRGRKSTMRRRPRRRF